LVAASATVGSGSVTPPKRMSNRKIKGTWVIVVFLLVLLVVFLYNSQTIY
jgi:hypothetical protein